jgi:predicted HTH transcriptional regulator
MKLAKSVSAFANTDGGRLLIGVRDDGHMSGVRSEEEIYMMHQAAYRYCRPEASIKFDTYHVEGRTIVIATVPPSEKRPICAVGDDDKSRAYIRIADENIVASPVHLAIWRDAQNAQGTMMTYTDTVRKLLDAMLGQRLTLNQLVRRSAIPRHKVITLLARLIRFRVAQWEYTDQQFLFSLP